jgi:hypothetical protein
MLVHKKTDGDNPVDVAKDAGDPKAAAAPKGKGKGKAEPKRPNLAEMEKAAESEGVAIRLDVDLTTGEAREVRVPLED